MYKYLRAKMLLALLLAPQQTTNQRMFTIYPRECLSEITIGAKTELEIPWVDGKADKAGALLHGVVITFDSGCPRAYQQIRRVTPLKRGE